MSASDKKLYLVTTTEVTKFYVLADSVEQVDAAIEAEEIEPDRSENYEVDRDIKLVTDHHDYTDESAQSARVPVLEAKDIEHHG